MAEGDYWPPSLRFHRLVLLGFLPLFPECDVNVSSMFLAPSPMPSQMIGMALCHVMIENGQPK